jgi:hypothetical protein
VTRATNAYSYGVATEEGPQSHFVFTLDFSATHSPTDTVSVGQFTMVLVGGAEFCPTSRSMQCLSDVFTAISKRQPHIPYRNSKLTYLLQPSFSLSGRSVMVSISPSLPPSHLSYQMFCVDGTDHQSYTECNSILALSSRVLECTIIPPGSAPLVANRSSVKKSPRPKPNV